MKKTLCLFLTCFLLVLIIGCAAQPKSASYDMPMEEASAAYAGESYAASADSVNMAAMAAPQAAAEKLGDSAPSAPAQEGDADVRKIIYDADMSVTADDPSAALAELSRKAEELGGYVAGSHSSSDDYGVSRCSATLKVPADKLDTLVTAAESAGKVDSYQLSSDDISLSYYDVRARLNSAEAEEKQLLEILSQCTSVEDVLLVRENLAEVRSDIESYTAQIRLWDELVDYATLSLSIKRTPRTAVEDESELIQIWKASDVWKRMGTALQNSVRFTVNAISAIGIFLAIAAIPAAILFLCIGLPIILKHKKKKKKALLAAEAEAQKQVLDESVSKKE